MSRQPVLKNYVSGLDQFLEEFDQQHPILSPSQQQEVNKYRLIHNLRDNQDAPPALPKAKIWEGF